MPKVDETLVPTNRNNLTLRKPRSIRRGAMLLRRSYSGEGHVPAEMLADMREIAAKGYAAVEVFPMVGEDEFAAQFCRAAHEQGLDVWVVTNYMKYQEDYLALHPEQRLVLARDALDQDGLSSSSWGCPFNLAFAQRGIAFLRHLAAQSGVTRISIDDEAMLMSGCYCTNCRADYARELGGEMPLKAEPCRQDWDDPTWRKYLQWKIARWNQAHAAQAEAIRAVNPAIRVLFQTSPACDLWMNPWETGVDLSSMIDTLDGLSTDPYHTFHERHFHPAEVYVSEWSKFLHGIVPPGKEAEIVPQGFSHPTFTRPLGRDDGYWLALVPPACGIDFITPYTYSFQKCSPACETYEASFALDRYFEQAVPLRYAGLVHGSQTEIHYRPFPAGFPNNYDWTRLLPVAESLRHQGIPYAYVADNRLADTRSYIGLKVLLLPEIAALSQNQAQSIAGYAQAAGNLLMLGALGAADEIGTHRPCSLLEELFDVKIVAESGRDRQFRLSDLHHSLTGMEAPDLDLRGGMGEQSRPVLALRHCVEAQLPRGAQLLAEFTDDCGNPTGEPAIALLPGSGRVLWFAGFPSRTVANPVYKTTVLNRAHSLLAAYTCWAAGSLPRLRVENWPPDVPMKQLRPIDARYMPTFEFFALEGEDLFIGLVTSYFKEPTSFPMVLDIPSHRKLKRVVELITNRELPFETEDSRVTISIDFDFETAARVYLFELQKG